MIIIEDGFPVIYCDCCGEECTDSYEEFENTHICIACIQRNSQENLRNN